MWLRRLLGRAEDVLPLQVQDLRRHPQPQQALDALIHGGGVEINFIWVNPGGNAATTVLNEAQTVTVTQTVNGGAAPTEGVAAGETAAANPTVEAGATGTVAATGATHSVTVGGPQGLSFDPPELKAAQGDTVIFTFLSQNHTATQSAFDTPCVPLEGGMNSGYQANLNNTVDPPPQVAMQVMVSTPLCKYPKTQTPPQAKTRN